jgi:DNA-binding NtrC family response regulator
MPAEIMVVDDEKIVVNMCQRVLEAEGYAVEAFTDSVQALERIKEKRFDIVVTDLKMGKVSGMDILREINERYPDTKVIMLTAYASLDAAIEAIREKIFDFFPKPVKIEDLKKSIKKALEG